MKQQQGATLVEVLAALVLVGIAGAGFLYGMMNITETTPRVDDKTTALSIAESQIDYIRLQDFPDNWPPDAGDPPAYTIYPGTPAGFHIERPMALPVDVDGDGVVEANFQKIRIAVWVEDSDFLNGRKTLHVLETYRAAGG